MPAYLVCSQEPWARRLYFPAQPDDMWIIVQTPRDLDVYCRMASPWPDAIFVLHWHEKIPAWITERFRCIGFHASDLPNFRGGDPIGNQQARGLTETTLTAFRLDAGLDTGPILLKRPLSLAGTKADVLERIAAMVPEMIETILRDNPPEVPQAPGGSFYRRADACIGCGQSSGLSLKIPD